MERINPLKKAYFCKKISLHEQLWEKNIKFVALLQIDS